MTTTLFLLFSLVTNCQFKTECLIEKSSIINDDFPIVMPPNWHRNFCQKVSEYGKWCKLSCNFPFGGAASCSCGGNEIDGWACTCTNKEGSKKLIGTSSDICK